MKPIYGDLADDPRFAAAFTKELYALWQQGTARTLADYIAS
jgi:mannitol 2-dehydrogenase